MHYDPAGRCVLLSQRMGRECELPVARAPQQQRLGQRRLGQRRQEQRRQEQRRRQQQWQQQQRSSAQPMWRPAGLAAAGLARAPEMEEARRFGPTPHCPTRRKRRSCAAGRSMRGCLPVCVVPRPGHQLVGLLPCYPWRERTHAHVGRRSKRGRVCGMWKELLRALKSMHSGEEASACAQRWGRRAAHVRRRWKQRATWARFALIRAVGGLD